MDLNTVEHHRLSESLDSVSGGWCKKKEYECSDIATDLISKE